MEEERADEMEVAEEETQEGKAKEEVETRALVVSCWVGEFWCWIKMARKIKEIKLDLNRDILEGWEDYYCPLNVKALRVARELGYCFPKVNVVYTDGVYRFVFGTKGDPYKKNYGGHSRSRLALEDEVLLLCNLFDNHRENPKGKIVYRNIKEIGPRIVELEDRGINFQLRRNLVYLPDEVVKEFMDENGLVISDGVLRTRESLENPTPF